MQRLKDGLERLSAAFLWLSIIAGVAMMLHVVVDVTGRSMFNRPFAGTTEVVAGWYMVAIAFLPWTWIAKNDGHIVAGMFQQIGSKRFEHWLELGCKVITAIFIGLFAWRTAIEALAQTRSGEVLQAAGIFVPVWPSRWLLPFSGTAMTLYLVLRVVHDFAEGPRDRPKPQEIG